MPLTSDPEAASVWLDGKPSTTVVRVPFESIREIRAVKPPLYGPTGNGTCVQSLSDVVSEPPRPPSATYSAPFGPKVKPRGLLSPVAKIDTFGENGCAAADSLVPTSAIAVTPTAAAVSD